MWVLGAVFFVAPIAVTVGALVVKYPGAGGIYLWTRKDFTLEAFLSPARSDYTRDVMIARPCVAALE